MPLIDAAASVLGGGLTFALGVGGILWKGDEAISAEARKWLTNWLKRLTADSPKQNLANIFASGFDRIFGCNYTRFVATSIAFSFLANLFFFLTYLIVHPAFFWSLVEDEFQRAAVVRQFSIIVVFVNIAADCICIAYCREVVAQMQRRWSWWRVQWYLVKDVLMKTLFFIAAMAFVFVNFAVTHGAFAGEPLSALMAVPPTLWRGLRFENLTAVYIYSAFVSSFWLWSYVTSALAFRSIAVVPKALDILKFVLPLEEKPVRSMAVVMGTVAAVTYWLYVGLLR